MSADYGGVGGCRVQRRIGRPQRGRLIFAALLLMATGCSEPPTLVEGERVAGDEILVLGDWGSGTPEQDRVAAAMADYSADRDIAAIVTTGDNFYSDDVDRLMEPYQWVTERGIPWLVTWGNHDTETSRRIELVEDTFEAAPRWVLHEWETVDLIVLDSTQLGNSTQDGFLELALSASDDPTIVVFHHPPYSCGSHGGDQRSLDRWTSDFDEDVLLVLNGHEHNYQRFEDKGVAYVVTGGGGRVLTELAECPPDHPERQAGAAVHHFVAIRLTDTVEVVAIDDEGRVIDEFEVAIP